MATVTLHYTFTDGDVVGVRIDCEGYPDALAQARAEAARLLSQAIRDVRAMWAEEQRQAEGE